MPDNIFEDTAKETAIMMEPFRVSAPPLKVEVDIPKIEPPVITSESNFKFDLGSILNADYNVQSGGGAIEQDLNLFYQTSTERGFSRDFQARVTNLVLNGAELSQKDLVYLKSFTLPEKRQNITTVKYYGVDIHSTGLRDYGDSKRWDLTFYCDQSLFLKRWFDDRLESVATNSDNRINANPVPGETNYAVISVVNDNLEPLVTYKLIGLFVVGVPGLTYSLDGAGKVLELKVTLGFQKWERTYVSESAAYSDTQSAAEATTGSRGGAGGAGGGPGLLGSILGGLKTVTGIANTVRGTANAVRGASTAIRGAGRAIRGR